MLKDICSQQVEYIGILCGQSVASKIWRDRIRLRQCSRGIKSFLLKQGAQVKILSGPRISGPACQHVNHTIGIITPLFLKYRPHLRRAVGLPPKRGAEVVTWIIRTLQPKSDPLIACVIILSPIGTIPHLIRKLDIHLKRWVQQLFDKLSQLAHVVVVCTYRDGHPVIGMHAIAQVDLPFVGKPGPFSCSYRVAAKISRAIRQHALRPGRNRPVCVPHWVCGVPLHRAIAYIHCIVFQKFRIPDIHPVRPRIGRNICNKRTFVRPIGRQIKEVRANFHGT